MAGVVANGGVDEHLEGLRRLGLISVDQTAAGVWHPVRPQNDLAKAVRKVLKALADTPDALPIPTGVTANATSTARALKTITAAESAVSTAVSELGEDAVKELLELLGRARQRLETSRVF